MVYGRGVASAAVNCTVTDVALFTVIVPIVTPGIELRVVFPCAKLVFTPVIVNVPDVPTGNTEGLIPVMAGAPATKGKVNKPAIMNTAIWARVTASSGQ